MIDDGSTDGSLEAIKSFGHSIHWESGANCGGNVARNRGFSKSSGQYVQFLDADDYLFPEKILRQVACLERSGADVVYEDWQRIGDHSDGTKTRYPVEISGAHPDVLEVLLGSWAPPPCAFLFKRDAIDLIGGWDEALTCAQDWELNIRLALAGAAYVYLSGCNSVYRRPDHPTVSTRNSQEMHANIIRVLKRTEAVLIASGNFPEKYRRAIAQSYFSLARNYFVLDRTRFNELFQEARRLSRGFAAKQPRAYRTIASVLGIYTAEFLATWKRRAQLLK